jgi:predicted HTH domain antitoxin
MSLALVELRVTFRFMTLTIADDVLHASRLSPEDIRLELAVALFQADRLTLAQAADLADMDRLTFQHVLAGRRIPVHYTSDDLSEDLRTINSPQP